MPCRFTLVNWLGVCFGLVIAVGVAGAQQAPATSAQANTSATIEPEKDAAEVKKLAREAFLIGVNFYKQQKYDAAIASLEKAVALDPSQLNARLYLAGAHVMSYSPERGFAVPSPNAGLNANRAESIARAAGEYRKVLDADPKNTYALKGLALTSYSLWKKDEAREYRIKAIAVDPSAPENYYWVGWMDWIEAYERSTKIREKLRPMYYSPQTVSDAEVCSQIRAQCAEKVEDGLRMIEQALKLRPDHDDTMTAMGLLYRERADYECDQPSASAADRKLADAWERKTAAGKKKTAEQQKSSRLASARNTANLRAGTRGSSPTPMPVRVSLGVAMGLLVFQEPPSILRWRANCISRVSSC